MNSRVTRCAIAETGVGHVVSGRCQLDAVLPAERAGAVVALQTEREDHRPLQKPRVRRAVRNVAAPTAVHADSGVFKSKRSAFFHVALSQGSSLPSDESTIRGRAPIPWFGAAAPWGLWQSEHWITPSFTRCLKGMENCARTFPWQP